MYVYCVCLLVILRRVLTSCVGFSGWWSHEGLKALGGWAFTLTHSYLYIQARSQLIITVVYVAALAAFMILCKMLIGGLVVAIVKWCFKKVMSSFPVLQTNWNSKGCNLYDKARAAVDKSINWHYQLYIWIYSSADSISSCSCRPVVFSFLVWLHSAWGLI